MKTLKDIGQDHPHEIFLELKDVAHGEIRRINKQIKEFEKISKDCEKKEENGKAWGSIGQEVSGKLYGEQVDYYIAQLIGMEHWIKHFFNLEEK